MKESSKPVTDRKRIEQNIYNELIYKVKFQDPKYHNVHPHLSSGLYFLKFLAKQGSAHSDDNNKFSLLKLWIPDTVVYEDGTDPFWIYSTHEGNVLRTERFQDRNIVHKMGQQYDLDELVAVAKFMEFENKGKQNSNSVSILNTKDLALFITNKRSDSGDVRILQRYIKCKGSHAFICRAHWRKEKSAQCFIITNTISFNDPEFADQDKYVVDINKKQYCSIIESKGGYYKEPIQMTENIAKFLELAVGVRVSELACDFIKQICLQPIRDESGIWWFVNCKAFALENPTKVRPNLKEFAGHIDTEYDETLQTQTGEKILAGTQVEKEEKDLFSKLRICKFCQLGYGLEQLRHKLSLKMIIDTEKYIKDIGLSYDWLEHGEPHDLDPTVLYQTFSVCKECYILHNEIQKLKRIHKQFANTLGIKVKEQESEAKQEVTKNLEPSKMLDYILEKNFIDGVPKQIKEQEKEKDLLALPKMHRHSILLILYDLKDLEPLGQCKHLKDIQIECQLLNWDIKYKINAENTLSNNVNIIPINKIQLIHFFVENKEAAENLIDKIEKLTFTIRDCRTQKVLGEMQVLLKEFKSPFINHKTFYQLMIFKSFVGYLRGAICWEASEEVLEVKSIQLQVHNSIKGLYIPPNDYCACHALPDEWMSLIPNVRQCQDEIEHQILLNRSQSQGLSDLDRQDRLSASSARRRSRSPYFRKTEKQEARRDQKYVDVTSNYSSSKSKKKDLVKVMSSKRYGETPMRQDYLSKVQCKDVKPQSKAMPKRPLTSRGSGSRRGFQQTIEVFLVDVPNKEQVIQNIRQMKEFNISKKKVVHVKQLNKDIYPEDEARSKGGAKSSRPSSIDRPTTVGSLTSRRFKGRDEEIIVGGRKIMIESDVDYEVKVGKSIFSQGGLEKFLDRQLKKKLSKDVL